MTTLSGGNRARSARPTIRDVAALARVSVKTVSRVVNGEGSVSAELTTRVQHTIGLVLEDLANPFSAAVIRAVEDVARHRGVIVLAGSLDEDPERERALVADFLAHSVDGLIIAPAGTD